MSRLHRRELLKRSVALGAAMGVPYLVPGTAWGANDTIRVAVAGINGRGGAHLSAFTTLPGSKVVALVDPDSRLFAKKAPAVAKKSGAEPKCYQDIRKALEDKNIDVVSVATTNHWHALITIWSCQAGKDVYVEKPCSHNMFEGRKSIEAARKYKRIVQHGTQSRSSNSFAQSVAAIKSGKYGKLLVAKAYCCKPRWSIQTKPIENPPAELDFDIWLGPAPKQPYHANLVHYNWHWFWDFGNGDSGNQGVHQYDIARWGIGGTLPNSIVTMGGRWVEGEGYKDQGETPNMELSVFDFNGVPLVFETRGLVAKKKGKETPFPAKVGNEFYMEGGIIRDGKFFAKGDEKGEKLPDTAKKPTSDHFGNFLDCVRSRKQDELNAEIEEGHYSSALCHLGNIPYRLGKPVPFGSKSDAMGTAKETLESLRDIEANLKGALDMSLEGVNYIQGPKMAFDPKAEKFVDSAEGNALLTRKYRAPYVVPDQV